MDKVEVLVSDEQINEAWGDADFGTASRRDVVNNTVLKCASGYYTGHTAACIVRELGLVQQRKWKLSESGKRYLYAAFSGGISL